MENREIAISTDHNGKQKTQESQPEARELQGSYHGIPFT